MRPAWRVDLKWVFGFLFLASVLVASLVYSARALTDRETATGIFTAAAGGFTASQVADEDWGSLRAAAAANPEATFVIPGINVEATGAELADLSKQEAVMLVMEPVAEANYEQGADAAGALLSLRDEDGGEFSPGPLGTLTKDNHDALMPFLVGSLIASVITGTLLFATSRGPGRAGAVGATVALGTAGFALMWTVLDRIASGVSAEDGIFAHELGQAVSNSAGDLSGVFLRIFVMTMVMVFAAVIAHFGEAPARRLWARYRGTGEAESADSDAGEAPTTAAAPRQVIGAPTRRVTG